MQDPSIRSDSTTRDPLVPAVVAHTESAYRPQQTENRAGSASELSPALEKDHLQSLHDTLPDVEQQAASWPVISEAQWAEFIRLVNLGQEADAVQTPPALESVPFSYQELFSEPPVDLAYDIVQGPIGSAIPQTIDIGPLNLDFNDLFDLSSYSSDVAGLSSLGDYQTELAA